MTAQNQYSVEIDGDRFRIFTQKWEWSNASSTTHDEDVFACVRPNSQYQDKFVKGSVSRRALKCTLGYRVKGNDDLPPPNFTWWDGIDQELLDFCEEDSYFGKDEGAGWEQWSEIEELIRTGKAGNLKERRTEIIKYRIMPLICNGTIPCHESHRGEREDIPFRNADGEIDVRIQRFVNIMGTSTPSKVELERSAQENPEDVRSGQRTVTTRSERRRIHAEGSNTLYTTHSGPAKKREFSTFHSNRIDYSERDMDDEEVIKQEFSFEVPSQINGRHPFNLEMNFFRSKPIAPSFPSHTSPSVQMGANSEDHLEEPPTKKRQRIGGSSNAPEVQRDVRAEINNESESGSKHEAHSLDVNRDPTRTNAPSSDNQHQAHSLDTNRDPTRTSAPGSNNQHKARSLDFNRDSTRTSAPGSENQHKAHPLDSNRDPTQTSAPSDDNDLSRSTEPPKLTMDTKFAPLAAKARADQSNSNTSNTTPKPTPPAASPFANASMADRIAIKKLHLNVEEMRLEVDFGDGNQVKRRQLQRRLEIAVSKLEIAEMEYAVKHGESYSG